MPNARSRLVAPLLVAALLPAWISGCPEADPKSPATWIAKLQDNDQKKVVEALNQLRKLKAKEAVTNIIPLLKVDDSDVRDAAAYALGEIGDHSAVDPLLDAIDLASSVKGADRANARIADALAMLGDKKALPALLKMSNARAQLVQLHAVQALGELNDPRAIPTLQAFVSDADTAPFITKNAIIALGNLKAADALPDLTRALLIERKGVSFVLETSYALLQIGKPAATALIAIMDGSDKDYAKWAADNKRKTAAYMSKGPVVLGDIADVDAVPVLIKTLKWNDPENTVFSDLVRGQAAEALGRIHAAEAAGPIGAGLTGVSDANMRAKFVLALVQIGDKKELPKLEAATKDRKSSITQREETLAGVAMLGDEKQLPIIDALRKSDSPDALKKKCIAESGSDAEAACGKLADSWSTALKEEGERLAAAKQCHDDTGCWAKKLQDGSAPWKVRERAAYELGRAGTPDAVKALLASSKDDKTQVRRAIYIGMDWATRNASTRDLMKQNADAIAAQYEADKSNSMMQVVNEDLKRVVWKVKSL